VKERIGQLGTLVQLREKERDEKRVAFARVSKELASLEAFLVTVQESISSAEKDIRDVRAKSTSQISARQQYNIFRRAKEAEMEDLEVQKENVQQAIANARSLLDEKRQELIDSEASLKAVEKILEKEQREIKIQREKKAEDEADEIAQSRWGKQ